MSVHKAISEHSKKQHELVKAFVRLDTMREQAIEATVLLCKEGQEFSTDTINAVTAQINELAKNNGIVPTRQFVTKEMVEEYVQRLNN
ncbi:YpbS family protein [Priestia flexa]|jgi:Protein of unknown function (DUF2533)|uniref:DUF2533 family protein n=2 Tax=Priestia TaxID=2800373 RepID=A0A0V8JLK0_9BACI|nr:MULTISPECIES: YpbS family protein [Bacillaceae]AQX55255.1 hypothetical protein BC359_13745 [Priestia flexa]KSU87818.1 hypothetical protein AS180_10920 [Priestia veravalensis]KZB90753.1 hypothetical protein A2U94_14280 [Bacillus sp. VT 712]MBN8253190.1 YpbS family protein [Priestia flexa]MBN8433831.1 YpbS family protein [Priestia flexa]